MATAIEYGLIAALVAVAAIATTSTCSQEKPPGASVAEEPEVAYEPNEYRSTLPIDCGKKVVGSPSFSGDGMLSYTLRNAKPGENFDTIEVGQSNIYYAKDIHRPLYFVKIEEHDCPTPPKRAAK